MKRGFAAFFVMLMVATIVFTKSRGGMLGMVAAVLALILLNRGVMRRGFGPTVVIAVLLAAPFLPQSFWTRMSTIVDEEQDKKEFTGSAEARQQAMTDGVNTFLEFPITGVGAGQFKNYNPPDRQSRFLETHNVLIQVAAETGIVGLLAFTFLILRAFRAAWMTRTLLRDRQWVAAVRRMHREDAAAALGEHALGMCAGLVGWFVCAMFASVAYNWTFYYVLALLVAARELAFDQVRAVPVPAKQKNISMRRPAFSPQTAP